MNPRVFITVPSSLDHDLYVSRGYEVVDNIHRADLVHFIGGPDVNPSLYGEEPHVSTYFDPFRDTEDRDYFDLASSLGLPMVGICRGGQFLNVMCGGRMFQDVDGHATGDNHIMVDVNTGKMLEVTSTHHQMMRPASDGIILAVASESTCCEYMDDGLVSRYYPGGRGRDIEVVYYPASRCLCYQPHPEYMDDDAECVSHFFNLIEEKLICVA